MTFTELFGEKLLQYNGVTNEINEISTNELNGKTIALYFSLVSFIDSMNKIQIDFFRAHWCGSYRNVTRKLIDIYKEDQSELTDKFDVVFVSWDEDQESFDEYLQDMPWKALPYSGMSSIFREEK